MTCWLYELWSFDFLFPVKEVYWSENSFMCFAESCRWCLTLSLWFLRMKPTQRLCECCCCCGLPSHSLHTLCRCTCWIVVEWPEYARRCCRLFFVVSLSPTTITADADAHSASWEERWESLTQCGEFCPWQRERNMEIKWSEMKHSWFSAAANSDWNHWNTV